MKTLAVILILSVVSFFMFLVAKGSMKNILKDDNNNKIPDVIEEEVKKAVAQVKKKRVTKKK